MTTTTFDERKEAELLRGRVIAERAKRRSDLARYVEGGKVKIMVALPGHPHYDSDRDRQGAIGRMNLFLVDDVQIAHESTTADEYPSEAVMAGIALAVGATVGFEGIPDPQPTHAVSAAAKAYNARLAQANKNRTDFK